MRTRSHLGRMAAIGLVGVLGLGIVGCGGDDSSSDSSKDDAKSGDTLTEAQFADQANALCRDYNSDVDELTTAAGDSPTNEQIEEVLDKTLDLLSGVTDDIADLKAPDSISDDVDDMVEKLHAAIEESRDLSVEDISNGEGDATFDAANAAADKLGLDDCAGE